ncbi:MFS transporter [Georgenia sp. H159]|uniref:MFS transporter n=1 Tax=Georgenia sp. H159 TaxID=3076115 RepID=UPI002D79815E|nr:MFS transporter [Georgenia sp. H159]
MTTTARPGSLWRVPGIRAMFLANIAGFLSFFLTLGALPAWAAANGHPRTVVGTVSTAMLLATLATQASAPALMRAVRTRTLVIAGLLLLGVPSPLYLVATELWSLYGLSVVRGVGFGLLTVIGAVVIPQAAPRERQGEAIGIYGLAAAVPNMFAVSLGAALTLSGSFVWVAGLAAVPVLALLGCGGVTAGRQQTEPGLLRRLPGVVRRLLLPSTLLFLVTLSGGGLVTVLPLELPEGSVAALTLLLFGATGTVARWRVGRVTDRIGHRVVEPVLTTLGVLGLGLLAVGLHTGSTAALMVGAALFGVAFGALQSVTLDVSMRRAPGDPATVSAVWNAAFDGGTAVGAAVIGYLAGTALGAAWAMGLGALGLAVVLAVVISRLRARGEDAPSALARRTT